MYRQEVVRRKFVGKGNADSEISNIFQIYISNLLTVTTTIVSMLNTLAANIRTTFTVSSSE